MYNYITGKVVYSAGNTIVVDNNGIGYEIGASNFTTNKFRKAKSQKFILIFTSGKTLTHYTVFRRLRKNAVFKAHRHKRRRSENGNADFKRGGS